MMIVESESIDYTCDIRSAIRIIQTRNQAQFLGGYTAPGFQQIVSYSALDHCIELVAWHAIHA